MLIAELITDLSRYYAHVLGLVVIMIWIPFIILSIAFIFIWIKMRQSLKIFPYLSVPSRIIRSRQKAIRMLFILNMVHLICWSPWQFYTITNYISDFYGYKV